MPNNNDPYAHRKHKGRYQPESSPEDRHEKHSEHHANTVKGMHNYGYHMDMNPEKANLKQAVESHHGTLSSPGMEEGSIHDPGE